MENKHPIIGDNPVYADCKAETGAVDDVARWRNKSEGMNDGKTMFPHKNKGIMKSCGHEMGSGCGCPGLLDS
jgi:hypothetical protein